LQYQAIGASSSKEEVLGDSGSPTRTKLADDAQSGLESGLAPVVPYQTKVFFVCGMLASFFRASTTASLEAVTAVVI
jgi:hypothetical protein